MTSFARAAAYALLLAAAAMPAGTARAQTTAPIPPELEKNSKVVIDYIDPREAKHQAILDRLKKRRVLEDLSQFLAPLKLPRTLRVRTKECAAENAFYDRSEWSITFCYEMLDFIDRVAPKDEDRGFKRQEVVTGSFIGILFHEIGHALFDIFDTPVLGREEDAADQLAAFIMMQFGKDVARATIRGTAYLWRVLPDPKVRTLFSDEHGVPSQRFFNFLCIAYGGDPATFKDLVEAGLLPKARADNCAREYKQIEWAFGQTILPYIDKDLMKKVQSVKWLSGP